jgi:hypothetical protein
VKRLVVLGALVVAFALPGTARATGGDYVFEGGTVGAQATVKAALDASRFNFDRVSAQVTIRITKCGCAGATPGVIILDEHLLTDTSFGERYAWGLVQHEYAHQIDYLLIDTETRAALRKLLGGRDWCYEGRGLQHDEHGCERFAEVFAWSYWPSSANVQREEARAAAPRLTARRFRQIFNRLLAG